MGSSEIYVTQPHLVHKIWGTHELASLKGATGKIGESWEVSTLPKGESKIDGTPLSRYFSTKELPYLVKFLDTSDILSVQVHPDTDYAQKHESSSGKTECWVILKAEKGAGIYLGFEKGVKKEELILAINRGQDLTPMLKFFPVFEGDFFYVPAGAVHAIGAGILLCEVQEVSGITYRVFDWNRSDESGKPRELHVDKALDVLNFDKNFNNQENFKIRRDLFEEGALRIDLVNHESFNVSLIRMRSGEAREFMLLSRERASSIIVLSGEVLLKSDKESVALPQMKSAVLSKTLEKITVDALKESHLLWIK